MRGNFGQCQAGTKRPDKEARRRRRDQACPGPIDREANKTGGKRRYGR